MQGSKAPKLPLKDELLSTCNLIFPLTWARNKPLPCYLLTLGVCTLRGGSMPNTFQKEQRKQHDQRKISKGKRCRKFPKPDPPPSFPSLQKKSLFIPPVAQAKILEAFFSHSSTNWNLTIFQPLHSHHCGAGHYQATELLQQLLNQSPCFRSCPPIVFFSSHNSHKVL